jgi:hypothetical protein
MGPYTVGPFAEEVTYWLRPSSRSSYAGDTSTGWRADSLGVADRCARQRSRAALLSRGRSDAGPFRELVGIDPSEQLHQVGAEAAVLIEAQGVRVLRDHTHDPFPDAQLSEPCLQGIHQDRPDPLSSVPWK